MRDVEILRWNVYSSPFGSGAFACSEAGVCSVILPHAQWAQSGFPPFRFAKHQRDSPVLFDSGLNGRLQLEAYFAPVQDAASATEPPLMVDWRSIEADRSPFQRAVLRACAALPSGACESYGELAKRSGYPGSARAAGTVMATNPVPLLIPCHRILRSGGEVGNYGGGVEMKRAILQTEGALLSATP